MSIRINIIIHDERVMIDDASSVEPFDDEFFTFVMLMSDFNDSALDNIHLIWLLIKFIQESSLLILSGKHIENPFVFDILWQPFEKVNLIQTQFKENLQRIIINSNVFFHQVI